MAENVEIMGSDGTNAIKVKVDSGGNLITGGNVAAGTADSGNPVKVGGKAHSTGLTAVTANQRQDLWLGLNGNVAIGGTFTSGADSVTNSNIMGTLPSLTDGAGKFFWVGQSLYNGNTWDRLRNNTDITVLASAARTATLQSADFTNYNGRGLHLVIDVTAIAATPSVVFTIQGKDAISAKYYTILASAAITGTGTTVLRVFPAATAAANTVANDILPRVWRIDATHADADSITYSVGASVIL